MMGRPSPRKDQHTRKAEQVSWLAACLTLCAFPFRVARNSGLCRFQRRSQLRGSNGFSLIPRRTSRGQGSPFSLGGPPIGDHSASPIQLSETFLLERSGRSIMFVATAPPYLFEPPSKVKPFCRPKPPASSGAGVASRPHKNNEGISG